MQISRSLVQSLIAYFLIPLVKCLINLASDIHVRADAYPRWAGGVHGDELMFVFGAPLTDGIYPFPSTYSRSDKALAESVLTYWINFIKTG